MVHSSRIYQWLSKTFVKATIQAASSPPNITSSTVAESICILSSSAWIELHLVNSTPNQIIKVETRLADIEPVINEFEKIQYEIENISENLSEELDNRESFSDLYYSLVSQARALINSISNKHECNNRSVESFSSNLGSTHLTNVDQIQYSPLHSQIKLPTIELPHFKGSYGRWLEYHDTYDSLIHKNPSINSIQKFHYLRAFLGGEAAQVISSLEISAANYDIAWNLLCERFANTRLLIYNHTKALFDLQPVPKESSTHLRQLIDNVSKNLRSLESLQQPVHSWDTLLIFMIASKLHALTAREWESYRSGSDLPTFEEMIAFLKGKADLLEKLEVSKVTYKSDRQSKFSRQPQSFLSFNRKACTFCKEDHKIYNCAKFLGASTQERIKHARDSKLCTNCLYSGHFSSNCKYGACKKCKAKHHSLLHLDKQSVHTTDTNQQVESEPEHQVSLSAHSNVAQSILSTAVVQIFDKNGRVHQCRALLDCGSQSNLITRELAHKLALSRSEVNISIVGIGHAVSNIRSKCTAKIQSRQSSFSTSLSCLVVNSICDRIPAYSFDIGNLDIPRHLRLADPDFHVASKIDILIGVDTFWKILCVGQFSLGPSAPVMQKTRFGWIVSGQFNDKRESVSYCNFSRNDSSSDLNVQLQKFWELEEYTEPVLSEENLICEKHFSSTVKRNDEGRFIINILLRGSIENIGDSKRQASKRFLNLEKKLYKNDVLKRMYTEFMEEYIQLGHMSKVDDSQQSFSYYLPHHGVLKDDSLTTKLRVVFDGSFPSSSGLSINDIQISGPTIQDDLFLILLRFRQHAFVVSADITKMYRQVLVDPEQRALQQIFWRSSPSDTLSTYQLNTVTYGTASASFQVIRCLFQLASENKDLHPTASKIIKRDFYVDDLLTGGDCAESLSNVCKDINNILNSGCFELRKWVSNDPVVLNKIQSSKCLSNLKSFGGEEKVKVLGLNWMCDSDTLTYKVADLPNPNKVTKRIILSRIAQIYDPLGLLSACTITAKIIMQILWQEKQGWDESVPQIIFTQWQHFKEELLRLNNIEIPRYVKLKDSISCELHGFSDASNKAYGAAIYVKSVDSDGHVLVLLLCAKSKVAPLKVISIPRLELCGALLLARLSERVIKSSDINFDKVFHWSDSTITLAWIRTQSKLLKTFVGNRVAEIQTKTERKSWHHAVSKDNPADLASRGISPLLLMSSDLWWHGPSWLKSNDYPTQFSLPDDIPELKTAEVITLSATLDFSLIKQCSSLIKLNRCTAYILRFINNCKISKSSLHERASGDLTSQEISNAMFYLVRIVQNECFSEEIRNLTKKGPVSPKSKLISLQPFLDSNRILRVGGRLKNSSYSFEKRHPILLPSNNYFTDLILLDLHVKLCHAGPLLLLSTMQNEFWPIHCKNAAKRIVHKCIRCCRASPPKNLSSIMGDLPKDRVDPSPPFYITGVDYAGYFLVKDRKGRGCKLLKAYVALFVCFTTRAVHLELVSDLTTHSFIAAFKRFVSRRGKPLKMYSDNGTNFQGANRELKEFYDFIKTNKREIQDHSITESIEWHFIPPQSPHFGGLWEAGVKSMKSHLKRVVGNAHLTYEKFSTILTQVESVLNSRPISALSSDPNDLCPLTPAHCLIGRPLTAIPEPDANKRKWIEPLSAPSKNGAAHLVKVV
ncbi:uncharacterized protein [Diabrotica undecimpunctata]|uniref:uncharacterized protein n=1 Tax=Diabrotica undecimpunctata TaxID=50387 RepID=UPI003B638258